MRDPRSPGEAMAPRIYVDVDEVLADTISALRAAVERLFGRVVAYEDIRAFDLQASFDLDAEGERRLLDHLHQEHVLEELQPHDGAAEVLERWADRGCEVSIMTGRPPSALPATRRWLDRWGLRYHTLASVDKYGRSGSDPGALPLEALVREGFDLAVEDSLDMAAFLAEHCRIEVLLLDRPWNRDMARVSERVAARIRRLGGWPEIGTHSLRG
jgi:uncharacterized HAD superfamily protein